MDQNKLLQSYCSDEIPINKSLLNDHLEKFYTSHTCQPLRWKKRDTGLYFSGTLYYFAGQTILVLVQSPEKRDNSAFWRVLAGHSTQHMSEKRDVPPKTGQLACMALVALRTERGRKRGHSIAFKQVLRMECCHIPMLLVYSLTQLKLLS